MSYLYSNHKALLFLIAYVVFVMLYGSIMLHNLALEIFSFRGTVMFQ